MTELDRAVLTTDLPGTGLVAGDVGTIVLAHETSGFEVEFVALSGETLAVVSVRPNEVRPVGKREVAHSRRLAA